MPVLSLGADMTTARAHHAARRRGSSTHRKETAGRDV